MGQEDNIRMDVMKKSDEVWRWIQLAQNMFTSAIESLFCVTRVLVTGRIFYEDV